MPSLIINELLCFLSNQADQLDRVQLSAILLKFYALDELVTSKLILVTECEKIGVTDAISEFKKKRLKTKSTEDVKEKVVKDILDIWEFVDVNKGGEYS